MLAFPEPTKEVNPQKSFYTATVRANFTLLAPRFFNPTDKIQCRDTRNTGCVFSF